MAISPQSYSVGNRVYNAGSSAPTRGTVDPMGYVDRELNSPSQSRSGLAAAALRRMQGSQQTDVKQAGLGAQPTSQLLSQQSGPTNAPGMGAGAAGGNQRMAVGRPTVSTTGRIQAPTAATGATGLPFDAAAADAQVELGAQNNQAQLDFERTKREFERNILMGQQEVEKSKPNDQRVLLEDFAGRGMAFSSGYGYENGQLEGGYAEILRQLQESGAEGNADLQRQKALWEQTFQGRLGAIQQAAARRAKDEADRLALLGGSQQGAEDDLAPGASLEGVGYTNPGQPTGLPGDGAPSGYAPTPRLDPATTTAPTGGPRLQRPAAPTPHLGSPTMQPNESLAPKAPATRELASFPAAAVKTLQSGGIVTAGDGRRFKSINGIPTVVQ